MAATTSQSWVHDLVFVAAIALPEEWADEFGTTINGMWADPDGWTVDAVAAAHVNGRRILVSVPLIALTHEVYESPDTAHLMDEVCRDVDGRPAEVEWYYWDAKPVYALCVHSPVVRTYLVGRLRGAIEAGVDVVNVDEINTSVGLMTREPKGSGFCSRCLDGSTVLSAAARGRGAPSPDDETLRTWLREDDELFAAFAREQEQRAFRETAALLGHLRGLAHEADTSVAITANVAGMGAFVGNHGPLWSAMWAELLDVVMLEAIYVVSQSQFEDPHAHRLLPRGTFAPLYRLGQAIGPRAPIWIAPQINVPRQLAGQRRQRYYELMFLEAYVNRGRWGYNWWPGVDPATRREATAPDAIKRWTAFMRARADLYVGLETANETALVYSNAAVLATPETHYRYLAVAQALYEAGVQFDVIYTGDDQFAAADLEDRTLGRYRTVIVPGSAGLTARQTEALDRYAASGGTLRLIGTGSDLEASLDRFWAEYRDEDRARVVELTGTAAAAVTASAPRVIATRYTGPDGSRCLVHLLNYDYREQDDTVVPADAFTLRMPWASAPPTGAVVITPTGSQPLEVAVEGGCLELFLPGLADHAVIEVRP